MYEKYFNLSKKPFSIAPDPGFLYLSDRHRDALAHLHYGLQSDGGFVLVSGEVGTGKTTLLRNIISEVPGDIDVAFILNPRLTVRELLQTICDELGIEYPEDDLHSVKPYIDQLNRHLLRSHSLGRSTVVVIDEAQNLSPAVLEQLRLLTNLETDEQKLLRIILVGQPELNEILSRLELRQLNQRITARYHLEPLKLADTRAYLAHRLKISGGNPNLFSSGASWNIHRLAGGIPRLINIIADRSLLGAFVSGKTRVDLKTSQRAAKETLEKRSNWLPWVATVALLVAAMGGSWAYFNNLQKNTATGPSVASNTAKQPTSAEPRVQSNPSRELQAAPIAGSLGDADRELGAVAVVDNFSDNPPSNSGAARPTVSNVLTALPRVPNGINSSRSQRNAFEALFTRWGVRYDQSDTRIPCDYAVQFQLQCTRQRASWEVIKQLNVPAILEMRDGRNQTYYLTAIAADGNTVSLSAGGQETRVARSALDEEWLGVFIALWPMPDNYLGALQRGSTEAAVVELRKLLGSAGRTNLGTSDVLDTDLFNELLQFQKQYGLDADGIVGPATWLMLHRAAGYDIPRLIEQP